MHAYASCIHDTCVPLLPRGYHEYMIVSWPVHTSRDVLCLTERASATSPPRSLQTKSSHTKRKLLNDKQSIEIGHNGGGLL